LENRFVPSGFHGALGHVGAAAGDIAHVRTLSTPAVMVVGLSAKDDSGQASGIDRQHREGSANGTSDLPSPDIKGKDDSSEKSPDQSPDNNTDAKNDSPDLGSSQDQSHVEDSSQGHQ